MDWCKPSKPCRVETPYGMAEGKMCPLGPEVNRLVTVEDFERIAEKGVVEPNKYTGVVSLSSCPTQTYGGTVRLVFDTEKIKDKLIPMCYVSPKSKVMCEIEKEADKLTNKGVPRARDYAYAKYAVSPDFYARECEYESRQPIPLKGTLKRVEYWIGMHPHAFNLSCERTYPHRAGDWISPEDYLEEIQKVRKIAEKLGVPFQVKSCFNKLMVSWNKAIELTPENLKKLAEGKLPEPKPADEILETCNC